MPSPGCSRTSPGSTSSSTTSFPRSSRELQVGDSWSGSTSHGRRVGGWVVALDPPDGTFPSTAEADRQGHRSRPVGRPHRARRLGGASLGRSAPPLPGRRLPRSGRARVPPATHRHGGRTALAGVDAHARARWRGAPAPSDQRPAAGGDERSRLGPTLWSSPPCDRAMLVASALRRAGLTVAVMPNDWASAAGGVDVVIGGRRAAWAPCPGLAAVVVVDEHDEALQEERTPTWHARDVVIERGRRAGVPVLLTSPCPTLTALESGPTHATVARPRARRLADRGGHRPLRRRTLEALAGHAPVDPPPARSGTDRGLRAQHARPLTTARLQAVPLAGAVRALRRGGRARRRAAVDVRALRAHPPAGLPGVRCRQIRQPATRRVARLREEIEAAAGRPVAP